MSVHRELRGICVLVPPAGAFDVRLARLIGGDEEAEHNIFGHLPFAGFPLLASEPQKPVGGLVAVGGRGTADRTE